ncbi:hypothetical protein IF2G_03245 [Cordyceps javanica]|nr:hypothetical protein IF2G_03245 [Cordyceps javanica]
MDYSPREAPCYALPDFTFGLSVNSYSLGQYKQTTGPQYHHPLPPWPPSVPLGFANPLHQYYYLLSPYSRHNPAREAYATVVNREIESLCTGTIAMKRGPRRGN